MIGDEETKTAVIVDPQRDVDQYVEDAEARGYEIKYVFLTHFHADFVSGHLDLRNKTGAQICLGTQAEAEFKLRKIRDGESLEFGRVRLEIMETPGHTPEGISILVYDLEEDTEKPHAVLTGDALFIGDVGRPDPWARWVSQPTSPRLSYTSPLPNSSYRSPTKPRYTRLTAQALFAEEPSARKRFPP